MNSNDSSAPHPLDALAEDFLDRQRRGERPTIEELCLQHPDLAAEIRAVFPALLAVEQLRPGTDEQTGPEGIVTPDGRRLERLGDFRILREVGRGGMGVVYEADQLSLGRRVALKVLPPEMLAGGKRLERFEREARTAARLHHTNIVPVYGVGSDQGLHYFVMQFIHGHSLDQVLREVRLLREGKPQEADEVSAIASGLVAADGAKAPSSGADKALSDTGKGYWRRVARVGLQAAQALAYAHGQGVLHRDIKPGNLLLDLHGGLWIADFGLAKADDSDNLTNTGDIVGTVRYMAPERFEGLSDARSDVYALGLTLYEMVALRPAFPESDKQKLIRQVLDGEPVAPRRINAEAPRDLETVVLKAIARDPAGRYQSAADLAADLERFLQDRPIRARRIGVSERFWRWCRRNPVVAGLTAALAVALVVVTVVALLYARQQGELASSEAEQARIAREGRSETERQIARQYIDRSTRLIEKGDLAEATLWSAAALQADQSDPERAEEHRVRLGLLLRQCPRPTHIFFHKGKVTDARFSPDGRLLATACDDGHVHLWDWVRGTAVHSPLVHKHRVSRVAFSRDGARLVTVAQGPLTEVAGDFGLVVSQGVRSVRVWDVKTGLPLTPDLPDAGIIRHAGLCREGKFVLTSPDGKTAQVWSASDGKPTAIKLSPEELGGRAIVLSPDGKRALLHTVPPHEMGQFPLPPGVQPPPPVLPKDVELWNLETGEQRTLAAKVACFPGGVEFSQDGKQVVLVFNDKAHVYDATTCKKRATYSPADGTHAHVVAFSPNGRSVLSYLFLDSQHQFAQTHVWSASTGQAISPPMATAGMGVAPVFGRDGRSVLLRQSNGELVLAKTTGEVRARLTRSEEGDHWHTTSLDGRFVATADRKGAVRILDAALGRPVSPLLKHDAWLHHRKYESSLLLEFSPDGSHLLTGSGNAVRLWPVLGRSSLGSPLPAEGRVTHLFLSPNGKRVALVTDSGLEIRDTDTGAAVQTHPHADEPVVSGSFSTDGRYVFLNRQTSFLFEMRRSACILDNREGKLRPLQDSPPTPEFNRMQIRESDSGFRPDGEHLLTSTTLPRIDPKAEFVSELRVWKSSAGERLGSVLRLSGLLSACWAPDGQHVLIANLEGEQVRVRLWSSPPEGEWRQTKEFDQVEAKQPLGDHASVAPFRFATKTRARFSSDGRRVLLIAPVPLNRVAVRVWDAQSGKQLARPTSLETGTTTFGRANLGEAWLSPDGLYSVVSRVVSIQIVHLETERVLDLPGTISGPGRHEVTFAPEGRRFILVAGETVSLYDAETGDLLVPPMVHSGPVSRAEFSKDGKRIRTEVSANQPDIGLVAADWMYCCVWDTGTGQPLTPPLRFWPTSGAGASAGATAAWDGSGQRLVLLESANRARIHDLSADPRPVEDLQQLVEVFAARRVNASGNVQPLGREAFEKAWKTARLRHAEEWDRELLVGKSWHQRMRSSLNLGDGRDPSWSPDPRGEAFALAWHLDRLVADNPEDGKLLAERARARGWLRNWSGVLDDLDRVVKRDPARRLDRSHALAALGRWKEALADLEQFLKEKPRPEAEFFDQMLAVLYFKAGDLANYESTCRRSLTKPELPNFGPAMPIPAPWPCLLHAKSAFDWEQVAPQAWQGAFYLREDMKERELFQAGVWLRRKRYAEVERLLAPLTTQPLQLVAAHHFVLAMALKHLPGQEVRAREVLAAGVRKMRSTHGQEDEQDDQSTTPRWMRRVAEAELLRQAEEVVLGKKP